jgi:serine/threonine protein kinase
MQYSF